MKRQGRSPGRVVCALNTATQSPAALAVASSLARHFSAALDGLHAIPTAQMWQTRVERVKRLIAEHNAREHLNALLAPHQPSLDVASFVRRGPASEVILAHAWDHEADLIMLGGGRGAGDRQVAGSVAARAGCAVWTVPEDGTPREPRRILLPVTQNGVPEAALGWCVLLANAFDSQITVAPVRAGRRGFWPLRVATAGFRARSTTEVRMNRAVAQALLRLRAAGLEAIESSSAATVSDFGDAAFSAAHDLVLVGTPLAPLPCTEDEVVSRLRRKAVVQTLSVRGFAHQPSAAKRLPVAVGYGAQRASA